MEKAAQMSKIKGPRPILAFCHFKRHTCHVLALENYSNHDSFRNKNIKTLLGRVAYCAGAAQRFMEMFINKGGRARTVLHHHLRSGSFDAAPLSNMTSDIKRIPPVVLLTMAARGNRGIFDNQPPRADCAAESIFFIS